MRAALLILQRYLGILACSGWFVGFTEISSILASLYRVYGQSHEQSPGSQ